MLSNKGYQNFSLPQYSEALIKCNDKKVCTNLAEALNKSHDSILREFEKELESKNTKESLKNLALSHLDKESTNLIIDDSLLAKIYAEKIEGIEVSFDGSEGRPNLGLRMLTALLVDDKLKIPIDAVPYASKQLTQTSYKSKSMIAIEIIQYVLKFIPIKRFLADAHFSTKEMLVFLNQEDINFLMKISRARKVKVGSKEGQLKTIFRLRKNEHFRVTIGILDGIQYYFYVIKNIYGATIYFISNDYIEASAVAALYKIRWKIELFHRTTKQTFGLGDCQMRSVEKQRQHALYVMYAYAYSDVKTKLLQFESIEAYIKHVRSVKSIQSKLYNTRSKQDLSYYA